MSILLPDVQYVLRPGVIEFRSGHPDLGLLPAKGLLRAAQIVLQQEAVNALSYGVEQGPGRLIAQLCSWLVSEEGQAPPPQEVMITGGSSQALDMLCKLFTKPGDIALVQCPTYYLALRIMHDDHQLAFMPIPEDVDGMQIDTLEKTLKSLQRQGRKTRLLYLVPTFNNPSGTTLNIERRRQLVKLVRDYNLLVVEDDVYHQLWYDAAPPPSIYSLAPAENVIRLGSFSKILAPGLRLGWMQAAPEIIQRCVDSGVFESGGGAGQFTSHVVAAFIELGLLEQQVKLLRKEYGHRRDLLLNALMSQLPEKCNFVKPGGGFFVWLNLPRETDCSNLLPTAEAGGVSFVPGDLFHTDGRGQNRCRLNFTMVSVEDLAEGARRLGAVLRA
jgi:DNA-binding transcriptional MocR family regulator